MDDLEDLPVFERRIMANVGNSNTAQWCDMSILGEEYVGQWAHLHEYLEQKCPTNFHMNGEKINFMYVRPVQCYPA